jgi:hypothetical protein
MKILVLTILVSFFTFVKCFSQSGGVQFTSGVGSGQKTNYSGASFVFTGINVGLTAFNGIQYYKGKRPNSNAGFALITGMSQLILPNLDIFSGDKVRKFNNLNYISGSATIVIGSLMLLKKKKKNSDGISFLPYVSPFNDGVVVGMVLSRN